jgi:subtilisin family serine protease
MGPFCGTANSHADSPQVIGVGGTDSADSLYIRSSVGPSVYGTLKPDVAAPGVDVVSAHHTADDAYYTMTGTSMAAPHVAGAIAILKSQNPNLSTADVKRLLSDGSERNLALTGRNCGGIREDVYPNHTYGCGRLNVFKSLRSLQAAAWT